jgi:hypothetical protein
MVIQTAKSPLGDIRGEYYFYFPGGYLAENKSKPRRVNTLIFWYRCV